MNTGITTLLRGTVTRLTHGRLSGRCPPVAVGSAVFLSSWGRTWAAALVHQMITKQGRQSRKCLVVICTSPGNSVLQSSVLQRPANWGERTPGFGTALCELLLEAKRSCFLIGDSLWNESHLLGSLLFGFAMIEMPLTHMNLKELIDNSVSSLSSLSLWCEHI